MQSQAPGSRTVSVLQEGRPAADGGLGELGELGEGADVRVGVGGAWRQLAASPSARRYDIGCLADMILGALLYQLVADGTVSAGEPVGRYLPELGAAGGKVRVQDLTTHSCGFLAPGPAASWAELAAGLREAPQVFPAGWTVNYTRLEELILSELLARVLDQPLQRSLQDLVLRPAGVLIEPQTPPGGLGKPSISASLEELQAVCAFLTGAEFADGGFCRALESGDGRVAVMRHASSPISPAAYSWGVALFGNGLWGQNGKEQDYSLGLRFSLDGTFMLLGATQGPQFRRDWILDRACAAHGFQVPAAAPGLGVVQELAVEQLAGRYRGGINAQAEVHVEGNAIHCLLFDQGRLFGSFRGGVQEDGAILGDSRWPNLRIEFLPHPIDGSACLKVGVTAYARV